jgi:hypothetical protein
MNPRLVYPVLLALMLLIPVNVLVNGSEIAELSSNSSSGNATASTVVEQDKCSNKIGSAGLKYPQDKRTECELEEIKQM